MLSVGMKLYNSMNHEVIIDKIVDKDLYVTIITTSEISFNNGREKKIQKIIKDGVYQIDDLGRTLFFEKEHLLIDSEDIINSSEYSFNKTNIIKYTEEKDLKIMNLIKSEAPKTRMSILQRKEIIESYSNKIKSASEEGIFYKEHYDKTPYFARMDFDTEYYIERYKKYHVGNYYEKFYIGKSINPELGEDNIIDWRSEIGSFFYDNKNSFTKTDIGVYNSEIMLKRRYKFNPNTFNNIYVVDDDLYIEGSVDPFLLEILEENRANHTIGDIIKSIQSNQNKIIRQEPRKNTIIQGCAGSGKTMILLHRLSYLKFNNYLPNLTKVKIITPNKLFVSFIKDLSNSLELGEIEHITMNDYYHDILERYIKDYNIKLNNSEYSNILKDISKGTNLTNWEQDSFGRYASEDSINLIKELYEDKLDEWKKDINCSELLLIRKRMYKDNDIDMLVSNNNLFNQLYKLSDTELFRKNNELMGELKKFIINREKNSEYIIIINTYYENTIYLMTLLRKKIEDFNNLKYKCNSKGIISKIIKSRSIFNLQENEDNKFTYKFISSDLIDLMDEILEYTKSFEIKETNRILNSLDFRETKEKLEGYFTDINNQLAEYKQNNTLNNDSIISPDIVDGYLMVLKEAYNICNSNKKQIFQLINDYNKKLEDIENKIKLQKMLLLTEMETNMISRNITRLSKRNDFIFSLYLEILNMSGIGLNIELNKAENNQIKLFILLNLFYLHYGPIISKDSFVFIDEGQDYLIGEYKLLNNIYDGQAIFNVFGDINQSLSRDRTILDWNDLIDILQGDYYEINENYRNTVQITNFCNKEFDYNHIPIGIRGPEVEYINESQVENIINILLKKEERTRIAIIKNKEYMKLINLLGEYKSLIDKSIIIGNVKMVKGLEFDTVFVFSNGMSNNELYISYTRSLRKLYIIESN